MRCSQAILTDGVQAAEARAGAIGVLSEDGRSIELLAQQGYDDAVVLGSTSPSRSTLTCPCRWSSGPASRSSSRRSRNATRLFPALSHQGQEGHALVVVPLAVEGRVFGAMSLSFGDEIEFEPERREMKLTLARQAAQALPAPASTRPSRRCGSGCPSSQRRAQCSRRRSTTSHAQAGRAALVPRLADWCAIDMVGPNGEIERLAVAHQDPEKVRWAYELQERYPPDPTPRPACRRCSAPARPSSSRSSRRRCSTRRSVTTSSCARSWTSSGCGRRSASR